MTLNGRTSGTVGAGKRLEAIQIIVEPGYGVGVEYRTHIQSKGWEKTWKKDGETSGTSGEAKRLEAIQIRLTGNNADLYDVYYRVHAQTYGWMGWVKNGEPAGTAGQAKRLEAIEIKLTGELAEKYDVYYRVHAQTFGWLNWAKNGQTAGTVGYAKRLEGIQIVLVPKGGKAPSATPLNDGRACIIK